MAGKGKVARPTKKSEYDLEYASKDAIKGWRDLVATYRNAMAETWDRLTKNPLEDDGKTMYPLKGDAGKVTKNGKTHTRWQCKPTKNGSGRIWYWVEGSTVYLEQVHTHHPNETN